jgi:hypothetical protein
MEKFMALIPVDMERRGEVGWIKIKPVQDAIEVPLQALDAKVDEIVGELLKRPTFALARTKRACNKHVASQMNLVTERAHESEMRDFVDHARLGGMDRLTSRQG